MRLELEYVDIHDIRFGDKTFISDGVLHINKKEAEALLLEDIKIAKVSVELAHPNDGTRIVKVLDIAQPRCKVTPKGGDFPGFISNVHTAGSGVTRALRGLSVIMTNPTTGRRDVPSLDMGGTVARLSKYAVMPAVVVVPEMAQGTDEFEYDFALQRALFRLAVYLAEAGEGQPVAEKKIYDHSFKDLPKDSSLPRIVYFYQMYTPQYDYKGNPEPFFYGTNVKNFVPTILHPNEVLDGGIVGFVPVKSLDTYSMQNHAMINELYDRHEKDLIFCGMIAGVAHSNAQERDRRAMIAANLAKDIMEADGIIMTKVNGGMVHMDEAAIGIACEKRGVRSVLQTQGLTSPGTKASNAYFKHDLLTAVHHIGVTHERLNIEFDVKRVLGGTPETLLYSPYGDILPAKSPRVFSEESAICGIHDFTGGSYITGEDY